MAACDISQLTEDSKCRTAPALTPHQQKQMLIFSYWLDAVTEGASISPLSVMQMVEEAKCWSVLSDDQIRAFEIQSAQNAYVRMLATPFAYTDAQVREATKCLAGLPESTLDRVLAYTRCQFLSNIAPL